MKFVYVLASDSSDIYYEQFLVSLISLKYWNPDSFVFLVCDNITAKTFVGLRTRHQKYVNDVKVVDFSADRNKQYRSRYLKTSLREILEGDFLYLDLDTIICDRIEESFFTNDVMGVDDCHFLPQDHPGWPQFTKQIRKSGFSEKFIAHYVNSGVLWMKDSPKCHEFAALWHGLWEECVGRGVYVDQPSLNEANKRMNGILTLLPGGLNCQVSATMRFFNDAEILHCFATTVSKTNADEYAFFFLNQGFYYGLKKREVNSIDERMIVDAKHCFEWGDTVLLCKKESNIYRRLSYTNLYGFIYCLFNSKRGRWLFDLMDKLVGTVTKMFWKH